ncbi:MAG: hypothetical protein H0V73_11740, partial [Chloroflexi bacterium]|nr:hypothetical protein [Chloroflexota bacterium]
MTDTVELCASCGTGLIDDPDDDPLGERGLPLCGECNRARNFDADEEAELLGED